MGATISPATAEGSDGRGRDAREVAWWVLVGVASGALAGALVGGLGGRLAMLLLRLTSPGYVIGVESDDGFEIGVVTIDTLGLVAGMAVLGGVNGVVYAAVRGWLPERLRLPLWVLVSATVMGVQVVHEDGIDFTLIEPVALAVALFVALPALAAALVVLLVERWAGREPFGGRPRTSLLVVAAVASTFALVPAAAVWALALAGRRLGAAARLAPVARIAAPLAVGAIGVVSAVQLAREAAAVL
jgi:hypothetical protein